MSISPARLNDVIAKCQAVLPLTDQILAAKGQVQGLQVELARLLSEISVAQQSLASEKAARVAEVRRNAEADANAKASQSLDRSAHEKQIAELKATVVSLQNQAFAEHKRLEAMAVKYKKLTHPQPVAGPVGSV